MSKIAKAITYAARQATLINQYGMTWEAIEVNTANILAGCSVPVDGAMNSAEAVAKTINEGLCRERDKALEAMRIEAKAAQVARSRLDELEARNVELRLSLVDSQEACAKLVKLRTYLENVVRCPMSGDANSLKHILEQTK